MEKALEKIKHDSVSETEKEGNRRKQDVKFSEKDHFKTLATISEICEKKDEVITAT